MKRSEWKHSDGSFCSTESLFGNGLLLLQKDEGSFWISTLLLASGSIDLIQLSNYARCTLHCRLNIRNELLTFLLGLR